MQNNENTFQVHKVNKKTHLNILFHYIYNVLQKEEYHFLA